MNLEKMTTEMSSDFSKMVEMRYGLVLSGRKIQKSDDPSWRQPPRSPASIRVHPAAVGREILLPRSSGGGAPPCPACVQYWWPESAPTTETRSA